MPKHLLYPRTKGFVACVKQLRKAPQVKAVYDVTVAYMEDDKFQKPPSFWQTILRPHLSKKWKFLAHVRRHSMKELPQSDQAIAHWLEDRWLEKGVLLEDLRERMARGDGWDSLENDH
jgi:hypothetical protein